MRLPKRIRHPVIAVLMGVALVAITALTLLVRQGRGPEPELTHRSEEDVLVENWWQQNVSAAGHVSTCRATGTVDLLLGGGDVWRCEVWYIDPSRSEPFCVSIEERFVQRRLRGPTCGV